MGMYEQQGYDAYVHVLVINGATTAAYANCICPHGYGSEERKLWMNGWQKAREEA